MPAVGDLFTDARGDDRTMRVSYHRDRGVVVVSLWAGAVCRGTFQMTSDKLAKLIGTLDEIESLARSASPAGPQPRVPTPGGAGPAPASAGAPDSAEPPCEQTGHLAGTADRSRVPSVRVPRVA